MDIQKGPASPGMYLAWGAMTVLALVILWGMGGVVSDWIAPADEPTAITAPIE